MKPMDLLKMSLIDLENRPVTYKHYNARIKGFIYQVGALSIRLSFINDDKTDEIRFVQPEEIELVEMSQKRIEGNRKYYQGPSQN